MFERYTESARRMLFFARFEASQLGATSIETEHLLLGLTRDGKGIAASVLAFFDVSPERIRADVESRSIFKERLSTSVEIPFTLATQRVLNAAAEEADALGHGHIGTEHLLLGLLRNDGAGAATILQSYGLNADGVRRKIVELLVDGAGVPPASIAVNVIAELDAVKQLVEQLVNAPSGSSEAQQLSERIHQAIDGVIRALRR